LPERCQPCQNACKTRGLALQCRLLDLSSLAGRLIPARQSWSLSLTPLPRCLPRSLTPGELRWDEVRAGRDLHVIDGLTVTKMSNEGGDYATVLGTLCVSSGQHSWNVYVNHVEDSNLFIGVTVGGHDLNADPQEMKSRTYYLSNGTIRVAGGEPPGRAAGRARAASSLPPLAGQLGCPGSQGRSGGCSCHTHTHSHTNARTHARTHALCPLHSCPCAAAKQGTALLPPPYARTAGKLVTRCAEPYAEGDLVTVHLDLDTASRHIAFYKNGVLQGAGDGLPGACSECFHPVLPGHGAALPGSQAAAAAKAVASSLFACRSPLLALDANPQIAAPTSLTRCCSTPLAPLPPPHLPPLPPLSQRSCGPTSPWTTSWTPSPSTAAACSWTWPSRSSGTP
jgi:hypothetical protein